MKRFLGDWKLMSAFTFLVIIFLIGVNAGNIACDTCFIPFEPNELVEGVDSYSSPGTRHIDDQGIVRTHFFGTDQIGRDVASRLIHGILIALKVGLFSSFIALLIAIILGSLAGFIGDFGHRVNFLQLVAGILVLVLGHYYAVEWSYMVDDRGVYRLNILRYFGLAVMVILILVAVFKGLHKRVDRQINVPWDSMVVKGIEVFRSIPRLFLLIAIFAVISRPSLLSVILVIGFIRWPALTRLIRAEILKVRQEDYIRNAQLLGLSPWRILIYHILPNTYQSIVVLTAFNMGSAILIEASLSFLKIGLPVGSVSWGSMLGEARGYIPAWWMAIGPGFLIFTLILAFNVIGSRLSFHFQALSK